jgi:hypothetical protein
MENSKVEIPKVEIPLEDRAQFEIDMLTVCYLFDKMPYKEAEVAARNEYREMKAMSIEGGL